MPDNILFYAIFLSQELIDVARIYRLSIGTAAGHLVEVVDSVWA